MAEQNDSVDQVFIKTRITPENFIKVKRDVEIALREKYGTLGTAIVIGKPKEWKFENIPANANDTRKKQIEDDNNIIRQQKKEYEGNLAKAQATLQKLLTDVAWQRVYKHSNYSSFEEKDDPIGYWKMIKESMVQTGGSDAAQVERERQRLVEMKQKKGEKVENFAARFALQLKVCQALGLKLQETGADIEIFKKNMDQRRYPYFYEHVHDKTLSQQTYDWVRSLAIEAEARAEIEAIRLANIKTEANPPREEAEQGNLVGMTKHVSGKNKRGRPYYKDRRQKEYGESNNKRNRTTKFCPQCKKNGRPSVVYQSHNANECRGDQNRYKQQHRKQNDNNNKDGRNSAFINLASTQPEVEDCVVEGFINMVNSATYDPTWLILDNGATIHTFNRTIRLANIRKARVKLNSVHKTEVSTRIIGEHENFGAGVVVENSPLSLISMSKAKQDFDIRYNSDEDSFYLWSKNGGKNFIARPRASLYVIEEYDVGETTMFNLKTMSGQERARKLHEALDHPYTPYLVKAVKSGFFREWNVTADDIREAKLEMCQGCLMGKDIRRIRKSSSKDSGEEVDVGERLHLDIVYFNRKSSRNMYLLAVDEVTGFISLYRITSREQGVLHQAIRAVIGFYKSHGFTTRSVHSDQESAICALADELNVSGVRLIQVAPDVHEKIAERTVRSIRNRWRATFYSLPYKLPSGLYQHMLYHVIVNMNWTPNNKTAEMTPRAIVTGHQQVREYVQFPFGTVGYFWEPNIKSSSEPKRKLGIYIGKSSESRVLTAYLLQDRKVVTRDDFVPAGVTEDIKKMINEIAENEPQIELDRIIESESYRPEQGIGVAADEGHRPVLSSTGITSGQVSVANLQDGKRLKSGDSDTESLDVSLESLPGQLPSTNDPPISPLHGDGRVGEPIPTTQTPVSEGGQSVQEKVQLQKNNDQHPAQDRENRDVEAPRLWRRDAVATTGKRAPPIAAASRSMSSMGRRPICRPSPDRVRRRVSDDMGNDTDKEDLDSVTAEDSAESRGSHSRRNKNTANDSQSKLDVGGVEPMDRHVPKDKQTQAKEKNQYTKSGRHVQRHDYKKLGTSGKVAMTTTSSFEGTGKPEKELDRRSMQDAVRIQDAIRAELKQMIDYNVWTPVDRSQLSHLSKIIPSRMFTVEKYGPNGEYIKHKSRLVAGGHKEWIPSEYDRSSPTVQLGTTFLALNIAVNEKLGIETMDVGGAFLEATLERDDVYVALAPENVEILLEIDKSYKKYVQQDGKIILRLKKAMYGLKEASMEWYKHLRQVLKEFGFSESKHDASLFYKKNQGKIVHMVLIHVDDMLNIGQKESRDQLISYMRMKFKKITVDRNQRIQQYNGLVIEREDDGTIQLSQPGHTKAIIESFGLDNRTTSSTPCDQKLFEVIDNDDLIPDPKSYRSQVMKLMYITRTRPDIKLPVTYLSTKMQEPRKTDYIKLYKIAKYLNLTQGLKMRFVPSDMILYVSADASHAVHSDGKGHNGYCLWLGNKKGHEIDNAAIDVVSKKQALSTTSSTESEMIALSEAGKRAIWTRDFLEELGYKQKTTTIQQDNKSSITLSKKGPGRAGQSKALRVRYFWISDYIQDGSIELVYISSKDIVADGYTKPLPRDRFEAWRERVLNYKDDQCEWQT